MIVGVPLVGTPGRDCILLSEAEFAELENEQNFQMLDSCFRRNDDLDGPTGRGGFIPPPE
jgi:hypothetical protein